MGVLMHGSSIDRRSPGALAARWRAAAAFVLLALGLAPAAHADCMTAVAGELWCATLTVGTGTNSSGDAIYGYSLPGSWGSLSSGSFPSGTATATVGTLQYADATGSVLVFDVVWSAGTLPSDGLLGPGTFTLHVGSETFTFEDPGTTVGFTFPNHGLSWSDGDTVTVRLSKEATDTDPPTLVSAEVALLVGLVLTFNEDLDTATASRPPVSAFGIKANGATVPVDAIASVSGKKVTLQVRAEYGFRSGETVTVSYTDPTTGDDAKAIQDTSGNDVATFTDVSVTNNSTIVTKPFPPTGLGATGGDGRIDLSWTAPKRNGGSAITGYKIEVSADGTTPWTVLVASQAATTYAHTGLGAGTTRHYRVSAINTEGTSDPSVSARATEGGGFTKPDAPTGLGATLDGTTAIDLSWTAPADDGGSAVTGYKIERSTNGTSWSTLVASHDGTSYEDSAITAGQGYYYRVSAINALGTSGASNVATAGDNAGPVPESATITNVGTNASLLIDFDENLDRLNEPPTSTLTLTVNGVERDLAGKINITTGNLKRGSAAVVGNVYRGETVLLSYTDPTTGDDAKAIQDVFGNDADTFTDFSVTNNSTQVRKPFAPTGLGATGAAGKIDLAWSAPVRTGGSAITGYRIEVSYDGGTAWTVLVADTASTATTYAHTGLQPATRRDYRVSAINGDGAGDASNEAHGTTTGSTSGPVLSDASVLANGTTLRLDFDENLITTITNQPPLSQFTVKVNGTSVAKSNRTVSGKRLSITLSPAVYQGQAVTVSYADPTTGDDGQALQDTVLNDAASFTEQPVRNLSEVVNPPPTVESAQVNSTGTQIRVVLSEALDSNSVLPAAARGALTVTADGAELGISVVSYSASIGLRIALVTGAVIEQGQAVKLAYDKADAGADALTDADGAEMESFTDFVVTNSSSVDTTPPTVTNVEVNPTGTAVTIDFSENLDTPEFLPTAVKDAFSVSADGDALGISSASSGTRARIVLALASGVAVSQGQTVKLSYNQTTAGTDALKDGAANEVVSFTDHPVTNNSTADHILPTVTSAEVNTTGTAVTLTFSENLDLSEFLPTAVKDAFSVSADGDALVILNAGSLAKKQIALSLAREVVVSQGQTVTVSYNKTTAGTDALKDDADNEVASFTDFPVTNNSTVQPPSSLAAPEPDIAEVNTAGNNLTLSFDKDISDTTATVLSAAVVDAFTISADGVNIPIQSAIISTLLVVNLRVASGSIIYSGQTVKVSYNKTDAGTDALAGVGAGASEVASFTDFAVTNNSTVTLSKPGAPTALTATANGPTRIDLAWTAPADDGGSAITGYKIEWSADGGTPWTQLAASHDGTAYSHTGLAVGTTRHYRVFAVNGVGTGPASNVAQATTPATDTAGPAFLSAAVPAAGTQVTLTMSEDLARAGAERPLRGAFAVTADGTGVAVQAVEVRSGVTDGFVLALGGTITQGQAVRMTYTDPTAGNDARALQDTSGNDAVSFDRAVTNNSTVAAVIPVPDQVTGLMLATPRSGQIGAMWDRPARATGYRVQWKSGTQNYTSSRSKTVAGADSVSTTITGLVDETEYTVRVIATNDSGDGPPSMEARATPGLAMDRPVVTLEALDEEVTEGEPVRVRVRLLAPWPRAAVEVRVKSRGRVKGSVSGLGSKSYTFREAGGRVIEIPTVDDGWPNATEELVVWLEAGRAVYRLVPEVRVRVLDNDAGVHRAPAAPERLEAIAGDGQATLEWNAPWNDGGRAITRYEYRVWHSSGFRVGGKTDGWVSTGGRATSRVVTGLDNDVQGQVTTYRFEVRAVNAEGESEASNEARARPSADGAEAGRPSRPRNLTAVPDAAGGVVLRWDAPRTDGGSPVTGYQYVANEFERVSPSYEGRTGSTDAGTTTATMTGLESGRPYLFTVRAKSEPGPGTPHWSGYSDKVWATPAGGAVHADDGDDTDASVLWMRASRCRSIDCRAGTTRCEAQFLDTATRLSLVAHARDFRARLAFVDEDGNALADSNPDRHVLGRALSDGEVVVVRVTAADGVTVQDYRVTIVAPGRDGTQQAEPSTDPLTASVVSAPEDHDGESGFDVRLAFSEAPGTLSYRTVRDHAFTVSGGSIVKARRLVQGSNREWEVGVDPTGDGDVTLTLAPSPECSAAYAICTEDGRRLETGLTVTVPGPQAAVLEGFFADAPPAHDGASKFTVRIAFSEGVSTTWRAMRDHVVRVAGGTATGAKRVDRRKDLWDITLEPAGFGAVTVSLAGASSCARGIACTKDRRPLSEGISHLVPGPAALSVSDTSAHENTDETMDFTVSLDRIPLSSVTVDYATQDGSAIAGEDYTAASGTLTFTLGQRSKTVSVQIIDDAKDEGSETFTLELSNVTGGRIEDGTGVGTINNDDHLQRAWLARFGRTVASQAIDAITSRLDGGARTQVTVGGQALTLSGEAVAQAGDPGETGGHVDTGSMWMHAEDEGIPLERSMSAREMLVASSFSWRADAQAGAPVWGAWGRFASGSFDGDEGDVSLSGEVTTGLLGVDFDTGRWRVGAAVGISEGDGRFRLTSERVSNRETGELESTLTAVYPYLRLAANARLDLWAMGGYGQGTMTVEEDEGRALETDIEMAMGAVGAVGALVEAPPGGGIALDLRTDAMVVRMHSDTLRSAHGNLAGADVDVSRLRLILEASRAFALEDGATLTPSLEAGLRHDGGDADTGTGLEVGARIAYAGTGVAVEAALRGLVAHESADYGEWGASASVRIDPGKSGRGLSLTLSSAWGHAGSASERLWGMADTQQLAPDAQFEAGHRLDAEVGYGRSLSHHRGVVTPFAGFSFAENGTRMWRSGARWALGPGVSLALEGTRHEAGADEDEPEHRLALTFGVRW